MTMMEYVLGRSDAETRRLILQNQIYGPLTRRFLTEAGITVGMRVLDLGSGAGDVALMLADLVGPTGRVVGVDANPAILETARDRIRGAGWEATVEFRVGDLQALEADEPFDAVVGRWVLMYQPDPVAVVRRMAELVRPGGIVAFQESDLSGGARSYPAGPLWERLNAWMAPPPPGAGPEAQMGPQLFRTFRAAGLRDPRISLEAPVGGGAGWPGYRYLAETMRSLLPFLSRAGRCTPAEVEVDTLADRLCAEAVERDAVHVLPPAFGAWARR